MLIGFRNNKHHLLSDLDGYFFCKGSRGAFGMPKTLQFFIIGGIKNKILEVQYWKVPEMLPEQKEIREIDLNSECLIVKPI